MPMLDIALESKTPLLSLAAASAIVQPMDDKRSWAFKVVPNDDLMAGVILKHIAKSGVKTLGYIGVSDGYGEGYYNMILNHEQFDRFDQSSLRRVCFGAAPMSDGLLQRVLRKLPHVRFQQAWGMTELSPIATLMDVKLTTAEHLQSGRLRSCGQAVATVDVAIMNEYGAEVPRGKVGEVVVRGPTVMKGYWQQTELTIAALHDGWMHSGDAGVILLDDIS
jgi:acyl-CoA synthetase (AMP-forming)/AMP-acid ligase II